MMVAAVHSHWIPAISYECKLGQTLEMRKEEVIQIFAKVQVSRHGIRMRIFGTSPEAEMKIFKGAEKRLPVR